MAEEGPTCSRDPGGKRDKEASRPNVVQRVYMQGHVPMVVGLLQLQATVPPTSNRHASMQVIIDALTSDQAAPNRNRAYPVRCRVSDDDARAIDILMTFYNDAFTNNDGLSELDAEFRLLRLQWYKKKLLDAQEEHEAYLSENNRPLRVNLRYNFDRLIQAFDNRIQELRWMLPNEGLRSCIEASALVDSDTNVNRSAGRVTRRRLGRGTGRRRPPSPHPNIIPASDRRPRSPERPRRHGGTPAKRRPPSPHPNMLPARDRRPRSAERPRRFGGTPVKRRPPSPHSMHVAAPASDCESSSEPDEDAEHDCRTESEQERISQYWADLLQFRDAAFGEETLRARHLCPQLRYLNRRLQQLDLVEEARPQNADRHPEHEYNYKKLRCGLKHKINRLNSAIDQLEEIKEGSRGSGSFDCKLRLP